MKKLLGGLVLILFSLLSLAQQPANNYSSIEKTKKTTGWAYASFGWHRIYYTNSTIHFKNPGTPNFDFRILKAKAFDDRDLNVGKAYEPPQWSVRVGYLFNNKNQTGIEFSYDHAKYYLKEGQTARLRGTIDGIYYDRDTIIHYNLITYEHTDGANYFMLSLIKRKQLNKGTKHGMDLLYKAGAGFVLPRTDSRILGFDADQPYHVSGYLLGAETTFRYEPIKNFFAEISIKGVFARFGDVLLYGEGKAEQQWLSGQLLFTLAYQIPNKSY